MCISIPCEFVYKLPCPLHLVSTDLCRAGTLRTSDSTASYIKMWTHSSWISLICQHIRYFFSFFSFPLFHFSKVNHGTTAAHYGNIHHFFPFMKSWNTTFPKNCPSEELQVKLDCDCSRMLREGSVSHAFVSFHVSFLMTEGELYFIPQQWHSSWKGFEPLLIDLRDMGGDLTHKIQLISTPVLPLSVKVSQHNSSSTVKKKKWRQKKKLHRNLVESLDLFSLT